MPTIRLNKFIAQHLNLGRRQADRLIEQGRVQVDGTPPILGAQIDPTSQHIVVNGQSITAEPHNFIYLALHKPPGYVCSRRQQGDTPTIYALLPQQYQHLKPVGRLDKDSSGLLLLTNDGNFAHRMTHPSFGKTKQYLVTLDKPLSPQDQQRITKGIDIGDGISQLILKPQSTATHWQVTMHEGRNRQIRRTFAALGYTVTRLHRVAFGTYHLDKLPAGNYQTVHSN